VAVQDGGIQGLVDTHCHLDFEDFQPDRLAVLERAGAAGVVRMLNPGIDIPSSREVLRIATEFAQIYAAVGVHPSSANAWTDASLDVLRSLALRPKVVAIGEIGLDYYRDRAPRPQQRNVLVWQLGLAAELGLPVVVHNRQSSEDMLELLAEWQLGLCKAQASLADRPGVLHSFSGDRRFAEGMLQHGFYLGIPGPVTFRNARELQDVVSWAPLDRLLLETDAPFMTPHPYRGKRNEPAHVRLVAEKIAELRGMIVDDVAEITTANAKRLFGWSDVD